MLNFTMSEQKASYLNRELAKNKGPNQKQRQIQYAEFVKTEIINSQSDLEQYFLRLMKDYITYILFDQVGLGDYVI